VGETKVRTANTKTFVEVIIERELKGTPLEGQGNNYVKYGDQYKVDPLLAVAIINHESNYCKAYAQWHIEKYHNCAGLMNNGQENGLIMFSSWESFIEAHMKLLANYIYNDGRDTVGEIGSKYAPVASSFMNTSWTNSVSLKYHQLWKEIETK